MKFVEGKAAVIDMTLYVDPSDFTWELFMFEKKVPLPKENENFPTFLNAENVECFFDELLLLKYCPGNSDFQELIFHQLKDGGLYFYDKSNNIAANIETANFQNPSDFSTIRPVDCQIVVSSSQTRWFMGFNI